MAKRTVAESLQTWAPATHRGGIEVSTLVELHER